MLNTLKALLKNQNLCEIYTNVEQTNKFSVGYVVAVDERNCLLLAVDFYGQYDGLSCFLIDKIFQIQTCTQYLQAIEKLVKHRNIITSKNHRTDTILLDILTDISENKRICEIELCDSNLADATGYVKNVDVKENKIELLLVDEFGHNDGETIIDMQMISHISYDSTDTIRLEILNK